MKNKTKCAENLVCGLILVLICFFSGFICGYMLPKVEPVKNEVCETTRPEADVIMTESPEANTEESTTAETTTESSLFCLGEFVITAYCSCEECCDGWATNRPKDANGNDIVYTASGAIAQAGRTVAVDPDVIPYGTHIIIDGHEYIAEDCGGAIKGNKIDIYCGSHEKTAEIGRQVKEVYAAEWFAP
jgi:3D (Asp-Asp-Asp) domain-containing protein